jgi:translation elongation factor EF-Tu-like GTPase
MDAAVFVLSAGPPLPAAEREFLLSVRDRAVRVIVVLNKADRLDPADLTQVVRFTKGLVRGVLHGPVDVRVLSAQDALRASRASPATGPAKPAPG